MVSVTLSMENYLSDRRLRPRIDRWDLGHVLSCPSACLIVLLFVGLCCPGRVCSTVGLIVSLLGLSPLALDVF